VTTLKYGNFQLRHVPNYVIFANSFSKYIIFSSVLKNRVNLKKKNFI
jgi:hypothetical protein